MIKLKKTVVDSPNLGNSDTGTIVLLWPLVTDTKGMRGEVMVGSEPVREWWFLPGFIFFILRPGEEWIDTVSLLGLRVVGAEFGARIINKKLVSSRRFWFYIHIIYVIQVCLIYSPGGGSKFFETAKSLSSSFMILVQLWSRYCLTFRAAEASLYNLSGLAYWFRLAERFRPIVDVGTMARGSDLGLNIITYTSEFKN